MLNTLDSREGIRVWCTSRTKSRPTNERLCYNLPRDGSSGNLLNYSDWWPGSGHPVVARPRPPRSLPFRFRFTRRIAPYLPLQARSQHACTWILIRRGEEKPRTVICRMQITENWKRSFGIFEREKSETNIIFSVYENSKEFWSIRIRRLFDCSGYG